jgi:hypothetical protein
MATDRLQQAISLIRAGRKSEAQALLEPLIKADPRQLKPWLWYAEACDTPEAKMRVLETCKRMNPDNPQVDQAIAALRRATGPLIKPTQPLASPPAAASPFREEPAPASPFVSPFADESAPANPESDWETYTWNPPAEEQKPEPASFDAPATAAPEAKPKFEKWEYKEPELNIEVEPPSQSFAFYDVWFMALFGGLKDFKEIVKDPKVGFGRGIGWYSAVLIFNTLVTIVIQMLLIRQVPELAALAASTKSSFNIETYLIGGSVAQFFLGMLQFIVYSSALHFLAAAFGGKGDFKTTVYSVSAVLSPTNLVSALVQLAAFLVLLEPLKRMIATFVASANTTNVETLQEQLVTQVQSLTTYFCVGCSVGLIFFIYIFILNVRALKAVHDLNTLKAALVVIITVVIMIAVSYAFSCCAQSYQPTSFGPNSLPSGY